MILIQIFLLVLMVPCNAGYTYRGNGWCLDGSSRVSRTPEQWYQVSVRNDHGADYCEQLCYGNPQCTGYMTEDGSKCALMTGTESLRITSVDNERRNHCWQRNFDANCYAESYGNFLSGSPTGATKCNPGSCTLGEAKAYCDTLSDCGGVTLNEDGLYTVRKGTVLKKSPTGETTWWKLSECSDSYDSITQFGSNSDKCSPGHWLNQYPDHLDECAALVLADPSCDNTYFSHASFNDNNCWCVDVGTDCISSLTYQKVVTTWKINGLNTGFLKNCHWEETKDDYLAKTAAYIGWTCASNEILTGFELQASEDDVTKVRCCELGGHSSVVPDSCIFTDLADPEFFQPEYASCNANEHMVFSGAYDKREEAGDAYTEVKVGRCCEVECDTPWCAGKDWGVNTEQCYTISKDPYNDGVQELVCPKGTLMTQIHDGHQGQAHGIQRVESVVCCALDLIEKPTKAPTKRPTDSPSPSPTPAPSPSPSRSPTPSPSLSPSMSPTPSPTPAPSPSPSRSPTPSPTDAPSAAPTTKGDCLLALRCSTDMTDAEWVSAIEKCCGNTAYYRRALKGRLLPEEAERM